MKSFRPPTPLAADSVFSIAQLRQNLVFNKSSKPTAAAVLLAITNEPEPRIMLTRRAQHLNNHAGEVSFPGGKRDVGDTSNIVVALREAEEETGLNPFQVELLGELPVVRAKNGLTVKPIVGVVAPDVVLTPQLTELDRIFWIGLRDFYHALITPHWVPMGQLKYAMASVVLDNEIIWGLTARILVTLLRQGLQLDKPWPLVLDIKPVNG